jgi:hypothetical protein
VSALNAMGETLGGVLEPWTAAPADVAGRRTVSADSGTTVDLNMARPFEYDPDTLYAWPARHVHTVAGAGNPPEEREDFAFQFVYTAARQGEEPQLSKRRDVSDQLDARAASYARAIASTRSRLNGVPAPWDHITSEIQHDTTITFGVRGIGVLVSGYRIVKYS